MELPNIRLVTGDEMHRALVLDALHEAGVEDAHKLMLENNVESRVVYRNVRQADGTLQLMASVVILSMTPKGQKKDG
jgi:hypothetical protein